MQSLTKKNQGGSLNYDFMPVGLSYFEFKSSQDFEYQTPLSFRFVEDSGDIQVCTNTGQVDSPKL